MPTLTRPMTSLLAAACIGTVGLTVALHPPVAPAAVAPSGTSPHGFGEFEPNDTLAQAAGPFEVGNIREAQIETATDVDYYSFQAPPTRPVLVSITDVSSSTSCMGTQLLTSDGQPLAATTTFGRGPCGGAGDIEYTLTPPAGGKFAIRVTGDAGKDYFVELHNASGGDSGTTPGSTSPTTPGATSPTTPSTTPKGTTPKHRAAAKVRVWTTLAVSQHGRVYRGEVQSRNDACVSGATVLLGRDGFSGRTYGSAKSGANGSWTIRLPHTLRGAVYATVEPRGAGAGACTTQRSKSVR